MSMIMPSRRLTKAASVCRLRRRDNFRRLKFELLEDRALLSADGLTVYAAGDTGEESVSLLVDGVTVQSWADVGGDYGTRTFEALEYTAQGLSLEQLRIAFTNDLVTPEIDRNLHVDRINLYGIDYQMEDPNVLSLGSWTLADGCDAGFKQSETLHCGGYFEFPAAGGSTIQVLAAGATGTETMELRLGGVTVATWDNVGGDYDAAVYETFDYEHSAAVGADDVQVAFTNDGDSGGIDRNLRVDGIRIDGVFYDSESDTVFSIGSWRPSDGCDPGFKASELLHCNGYFQYAGGPTANPGVISLASSSILVNEANGSVDVTIQRTGGTDGGATVDYRSISDTATAGSDYVSVSGRAIFADGETSKTIPISILQDSLLEGNEQFSFTIDNVNGGPQLLVPRTAIITIQDDESPPTLDGFAVSIDDFGSAPNVIVNGDTRIAGNTLELTPAMQNQQGSAFYDTAVEFDPDASFATDFAFQVSGGQGTGGADGFTFALQNAGGAAAALGNGGGNLGFGSIGSASFAIEFDTYANEYDINDNHISVLVAGDVTTAVASVSSPFELNSGSTLYAWIEYDGPTNSLKVYASDINSQPAAAVLSTTIDLAATLGSQAYFGFTAATGGLTNVHQVIDWTFASSTDLAPTVADFVGETLVSGLLQPTAIDFSADGRNMYIAEQRGTVRVVRDGQLLANDAVDIRDHVNGTRDRGLLDIAIHPDLGLHPYLYLLYTYDPPEVNNYTGLAGPDGRGNRAARLTRIELDSSTNYTTVIPGTETVILGSNSTWDNFNAFANSTFDFDEPPAGILPDGTNLQDFLAADSESHTIGSVEFGPDGALYISNGDGASYNQVDPRAVRVQDIDNLSGKVLRIDPITGAGLVDNPFYNGDPAANRSKVYHYGFRNPFRITVDQQSSQVFIGDVGWTRWEEVNTAAPGANFGWPYYEGGGGINIQTPGYEDLTEAQAFYDSGQIATPAIFALSHSSDGINAIVMGDIYAGNQYPSEYQGDLLVNDLGQGIVRNISFDPADSITNVETFATGANVVVHIKLGPDGLMYYTDLDDGLIGRWVPDSSKSSFNFSENGDVTGSNAAAEATLAGVILKNNKAIIDMSRAHGSVVVNLADQVLATDDGVIELDSSIRSIIVRGQGSSHKLTVVGDALQAKIRNGRAVLQDGAVRVKASGIAALRLIGGAQTSEAKLLGRDRQFVGADGQLMQFLLGPFELELIGFDSILGVNTNS